MQEYYSPQDRQAGLTVWFIRHGESEAHVGKAAAHSEEIRLTAVGKRQAEEIASRPFRVPDLVISSPFMRAWETALPTLKRFPDVPYEIWSVHEFTYLGSLSGIRLTKEERRPKVEEYWRRCDPFYRDGDSESFAQFIQRARTTIELLKRQKGFVMIFTHEQFMRAMQWLLQGWLEATAEHMAEFRRLLVQHALYNGYVLEMPIGNGQERFRQITHVRCSPLITSSRH